MTALVGMVALVAGLAAVAMFLRSASAETLRKQLADRASDLEKRLANAHEELNGAREDLKRRQAALDDARERAAKLKKKETRELQKGNAPSTAGAPDPTVMARFQAAVEAAERRAVAAEKELEARLVEARDAVRRELEKDVEELKRRLQRAEKKADEKPVEEKVEARPERPNVPGARIDLTKLEPAVVEELRRFYKRASTAEKLLAVADSKLELAQDKLEETQKRYFAVCRELALVAVNKDKPQDVSDAEAARLANEMVAASEEAGRRRSVMGTPRRRPLAMSRPAEGGAESSGAEGEERRGRRRRRGGRDGAPGEHREARRPEGERTDAPKGDAPKAAEAPKAADAPKAEAPKPAAAPAE